MGGEASTTAANTARYSYRRRSLASSPVIVATAAAAAYAYRAIATCSAEEAAGSDKRLIQVTPGLLIDDPGPAGSGEGESKVRRIMSAALCGRSV